MAETLLNSAEATHQQIVHPSHKGATEAQRREEEVEHSAYKYIRLSDAGMRTSIGVNSSHVSPDGTPLSPHPKPHVPFGQIAGRTPSGIAAYSNGSDTHFSNEKALWKRSRRDGGALVDANSLGTSSLASGNGKGNGDSSSSRLLYTGYKWQCVEFARRWLLQHRSVLLPDVQIAAHIIYLENMLHVPTGREIKVKPVLNGTFIQPTAGSLIIYPQSNENFVGHVGVIVEATDRYVRVADQNRFFHNWGADHYSAEYVVERDSDGRYWIRDDVIAPVGWVTFPTAPDYVVDSSALVPKAVGHSEHNGVLYSGINPPLSVRRCLASSATPCDGDSPKASAPADICGQQREGGGDGGTCNNKDEEGDGWLSDLAVPEEITGGVDLGLCTYLRFWGRSMMAFKGKVVFAATLGRILAFVSWRVLTDWARRGPKVADQTDHASSL